MKIGKTITKITYEYSDGSTDSIDFKTYSEPVTKPVAPNVLYAEKCPRCGLDLSSVMGYSCPNWECPIQSQVTS